jgi:hypothetical protein
MVMMKAGFAVSELWLFQSFACIGYPGMRAELAVHISEYAAKTNAIRKVQTSRKPLPGTGRGLRSKAVLKVYWPWLVRT